MDDAIKARLKRLPEVKQREVLKSYLSTMISDFHARNFPALIESSKRAREIRDLFPFSGEEVIAMEQQIDAELRKTLLAIPVNRKRALE